MKMVRFGRTNVQVPVISLGTWGHGGPNVNDGASVGWSGHDDQQAREALVEAHRRGITHWDTADAYGAGHAEQLIGEVFSQGVPRSEIFLATKFGWVKGPHDHFYDAGFLRSQCEQSLKNMKTDVIDLHYFHHCDFGPDDRYFDEALAAMRKLQQEGKIRFIGLSDWDAGKIMRFIERVDPDVVQPFRNVVDDQYESSGLKAWVDAHDLGVAFFSPLKHGLLLGKYDGPQEFPVGDFRSGVPEFRDAAFVARMRQARDAVTRHFPGRQEAVLQALTGVLLAGNDTATVLLGQRNRRQVDAAAAAGGEPPSETDAAWVRKLYRGDVGKG
jgi:Predicted oxidoreductases (related to aryl-alcohol dehydrogenases)